MLGHKVEETDQMFHTFHKFCHKICYPHPPGHDMSQKIVFTLSLSHPLRHFRKNKAMPHHYQDGRRYEKMCKSAKIKMNLEYEESEVGEENILSDDNRSGYEGVQLHTLILSTGNLHILSQQIMMHNSLLSYQHVRHLYFV
jgi:hypothetical protein